jgi:hypothetical protein
MRAGKCPERLTRLHCRGGREGYASSLADGDGRTIGLRSAAAGRRRVQEQILQSNFYLIADCGKIIFHKARSTG